MINKMLASALEALTSKKGVTLAIPAVLLFGAAMAIGKQAPTPATPAATAAVVSTAAPSPVAATPPAEQLRTVASGNSFSADQKKQIEEIIKSYLINNPEVMVEIQTALESKMEKIQSEKMQVAITQNAAELFRSVNAPTAGNPKGDITLVEFFDYNCGYCKKALPDLASVVAKDKNVKIVMKEFPILSKGSEEASKVALAAKMQNKYWEFHSAMMENQGQANEAVALKVAEKIGLNVAKLKVDMASAEVKKEIDDTRKLAQKMGIQGTPHFMIGDRVIPGAPEGLGELLLQTVSEVRKSGGCKVC
jgi:protein-disulfide isomerase